jgi:hypothetical protein
MCSSVIGRKRRTITKSDLAFLQRSIEQLRMEGQQMKDNAGMPAGKILEQRGAKAHADVDRAIPRRRVGEVFNMLHPLSELIERDQAAIEKGTTVNRRLDALRTAIEETNAKREFHLGDRLRDGGAEIARAPRQLFPCCRNAPPSAARSDPAA